MQGKALERLRRENARLGEGGVAIDQMEGLILVLSSLYRFEISAKEGFLRQLGLLDTAYKLSKTGMISQMKSSAFGLHHERRARLLLNDLEQPEDRTREIARRLLLHTGYYRPALEEVLLRRSTPRTAS